MMNSTAHHHYNPDWLSDDALLANFVARQNDFAFLRDELARAPLEGSVQHYLLVGVRGAGKTTLLKRLAVAIRRDVVLSDHLIALSFPEELYQVKNLADFWWAACDALVDELDVLKLDAAADELLAAAAQARHAGGNNDPISDAGFKLLQRTCAQLKRRPVMLVDNLDMVFQRIDKTGRKLNDPHAPAYWSLREALSTSVSPVVIGGSVRLSSPFTDYDKAFYDFFLPRRLGKLRLDEARQVLEHLAEAQGLPDVKQRLRARPGRIEALFELTGGNPRALGLIFELLRSGPNGRAVEDFERLMDLTTPYYKARIEDLSEQAQVIVHALAVQNAGDGDGLRFGHTAAEIGAHAGLPTSTVSAQLAMLENEGVVEKSATHGRTQYRIAEQLFRLWLQMRGTRRIRQNVIGLTKFFEAMYDAEELQARLKENCGASALAEAKFAFAVAATRDTTASQRHELEAYGTDRLTLHLRDHNEDISDYLPDSDQDKNPTTTARSQQPASTWREQGILAESHGDFAKAEAAFREAIALDPVDAGLWLIFGNVLGNKLNRYNEAEEAFLKASALKPTDARPLAILGILLSEKLNRHEEAAEAFRKAISLDPADPMLWTILGNLLTAKLNRHDEAEAAYRQAIAIAKDPADARVWIMLGNLLDDKLNRHDEAEAAFRKAIALNPSDAMPWLLLGILLEKFGRYDHAEEAYRKAIEVDPEDVQPWIILGDLLANISDRCADAEAAYHHAIALDQTNAQPWKSIGNFLINRLDRQAEAEAAYRKAIVLNPADAGPWSGLGNLLTKLGHNDEAELAYRKAIALEPSNARPWVLLGILLNDKLNRYDEAAIAYRKATSLNQTDARPWIMLGELLTDKLNRYHEAEVAYRKAIELDPAEVGLWVILGDLLADRLNRYDEAEEAYRKAIVLDPTEAGSWNNLGNLLANKLERLEEAEAAYNKAMTLDPADAAPWNNFGNLLANKLGRLVEAEAAYRKAITLDPVDAGPWNNLGNLLANKLERLDEAEAAYRKAMTLDPADAGPWNNLGNLLADKQERFDEAAASYRKAITLNPDDAGPWNNLGNLLANKLDRLDEAEAAYRKAIAIDPTDARLRNNIGFLLETLQREDEALAAYEQATRLNVDSNPYWSAKQVKLRVRLCVSAARHALDTVNLAALRDALARLLADPTNTAAALVSEQFVEDFLAPVLSQAHTATTLLAEMRGLGYEKYARPLLLAFEAAIENRSDMLAELEPEIQGATKRMFKRLRAGPAKI